MFKTNTIDTEQTLGDFFAETRIEADVSLKEAAETLHIMPQYIKALEDGDYGILPGDIYARCFIRSYAKYLELDADAMIRRYDIERKIFQNINQSFHQESDTPPRKVSAFHFLVTPRIVRSLMIVFVALICLTYLGFKVEAFVRPPELFVAEPSDNILISENVITISGKAELEAAIVINGQDILADEDGYFSEQIDLNEGLNVINISARKDHSKENIIVRKVVVKSEIN